MPPDEPARPVQVVLRIKLRYEDVDAMVQKFAPNVGKAGLFLPTRSMQAIGTEVKFELRLANDTPVIVGLGRVKVAREPDPARPKATFGLGIELMRVTRESRDLILRMLERRRQLGLTESAVPMPDDIDAARRAEVDTATKDAVATALPPVVTRASPEPLLTAPRTASGPLAVARDPDSRAILRSRPELVVSPLAPEPSRRHVRRSVDEVIASVTGRVAAGPITGDMFGPGDEIDVTSVLSRARALAAGTDLDAELQSLRELASAPLAEISIEAASAELARQLGGKPVDRKNRSRWELPPPSAPAPAITEVDREPDESSPPEPDASSAAVDSQPTAAELAEIANPHKTAVATILAALVPERVAETEAAVEAALQAAPVGDFSEPQLESAEASTSDPDEDDPALAISEDSVLEEDDLHELDDADVHEDAEDAEDAEEADDRTDVAADADDPRVGYLRDESPDDELELAQQQAALASHAADEAVAQASLEAMAADAEGEGEGDVEAPSPFVLASAEPIITEPHRDASVDASPRTGLLIDDDADPAQFEAAGPPAAAELERALEHALDLPLEADAEFDLDDANERTQFGGPDAVDAMAFDRHAFQTEPGQAALAASLEQQLAEAEANEDFGFGGAEEEIDDFEILAEADLDDVDPGVASARPGTDDFVSRLELSNEHGSAPESFDEFDDSIVDPLAGFRDSIPVYGDVAAAYQAPHDPLAGFSDEPDRDEPADNVPQPTWDPVSGSYTFANPAAPQRGASEFDEPHSTGHGGAQAFDESDVQTPPVPHTAIAQARYLDAMPLESGDDNLDLENALEALDVDLDELMIPSDGHATLRLRPSTPVVAEVAANRRDRLPRAVSEDGILIDFDDDD